MNKFDLLKSHIDAYTRKDGGVVAAHDDNRVAAQPKPPSLATHADALRRSTNPGDLDHEDNQIAAGYMKSGSHKFLAGHIKNLDTAARDHILDHVHPDHREGLGFKQIDMGRSKKQYAEKFGGKTEGNAESKAVDDGHDPVKSKYHSDKAKWHVDQIKKGVNQDGHISAAKSHIHAANLYGSHDNSSGGNDSWAEDAEDHSKRASVKRDDY